MADQLKRAAQSVTQNIAEGAGKISPADKARYFVIARGSATECAGHLDVMRVEELVEPDALAEGLALIERVVAMQTRMVGF